ncbi:MAG: leucine-rich repeat domain-containing protein [Cytophagales bacterium]|nr:MAG: leucine-rich repeat domain-containing protein [Cytophagales bacterium]
MTLENNFKNTKPMKNLLFLLKNQSKKSKSKSKSIKLSKSLVLSLLFLLFYTSASAQCDFLKDGMALEKQGKYQEAIRKYILAVKDCGKDAVTAMGKINALMLRIEKAEKTAKQEAEKAKKALAETEKQKQIADENLQKANKLINAFYFYDGKFAVALGLSDFGYNVSYFIDKEGNKIAKLGEYKEANNFDKDGWAYVSKVDGKEYLLDTLGNTYRVAYNLADLSPDIEALDLRNKEQANFPLQALQYPQLKILIMDNGYDYEGKITIPEQINELQALTFLKLKYCKIDTLPPTFFELKNLTEIDLRSNEFSSLPAKIGELKSLTSLDLGGNQLTTLPTQIGELKNLTSLYLSSNQLSTLPDQIGELKNLTTLSLSSNQFSTLPDQIGELKNLAELNLSGNQLSTLPD